MSKINEYVLRITGGAYLGKELDASKVINLTSGEVSIYSVEKRDNQDGTFDIHYKGKFTSPIEITQGGEVIRGRDKTSESKKTRYAVKCFAAELGETDTDLFYEIFQQKLRSNIHDVWSLLKNK